jgi:hypothetical protein
MIAVGFTATVAGYLTAPRSAGRTDGPAAAGAP